MTDYEILMFNLEWLANFYISMFIGWQIVKRINPRRIK